jgi:hypothetical protein
MNTETHGLKKVFCCFKQKIEWGVVGTSVYRCKSVANLIEI